MAGTPRNLDDKLKRSVHKLIAEGKTKAEIARQKGICRQSVINISKEPPPPEPKPTGFRA